MGSFNFRFIFKTIGFLLIIESLLLMISAAISFYYHELSGDAFLISGSITIVVGIMLRFLGVEPREKPIGKREGFLLVSISGLYYPLSVCSHSA